MNVCKVSTTVSEDGLSVTISVNGRLTIDTCGEFQQTLTDALNGSTRRVALDMELLEEADLTALQLVCSACKTSTLLERCFVSWNDLPDCLVSIVNSLGVSNIAHCHKNMNEQCIWFGGEE